MNYEVMALSIYEKLSFLLGISLFGFLVGWLFYDSILVSVALTILLSYLYLPYENYLKEKRSKELLMQFKDLLYSVSSSVSVGRSIGQALEESYMFWINTYKEDDYIMIELENMQKKMNESRMTDIEVLEDFSKRSGLCDVEDMVMVCRTCKKTGGNIALALTRCSNVIADKIYLQRELETLVSQKKFEGRVVALAPFVILLIVRLASPSYFEPMITTSTGIFISTFALVLIFVGWMYIERVNNIEI